MKAEFPSSVILLLSSLKHAAPAVSRYNRGLPMDRRPLKTRDRGWAKALASLLVRWRVRPNVISLFSIVFALGAGAALIASRNAEGVERVVLLVAAAACIQLRLLCNLFDGMVAVEAKM